MKVVNVLNDSLKSQDLKNKIIIISKSQLNQVCRFYTARNICVSTILLPKL